MRLTGMPPLRLLTVALLLGGAVMGLAACGGAGGAASPGASRAGYDLTIAGYAFGPATLTVAPGRLVRVVNADRAVHDVTSDTKGLFATMALSKDAAGTFTAPTTPGRYTYGCSFHLDMHGALIVR